MANKILGIFPPGLCGGKSPELDLEAPFNRTPETRRARQEQLKRFAREDAKLKQGLKGWVRQKDTNQNNSKLIQIPSWLVPSCLRTKDE